MRHAEYYSDTEVTLTIFGFLLLIVLMVVKFYFHFQYLKTDRGYFKKTDSFLSVMMNPFSSFKYFPEFFIMIYVPVFWDLKRSSARYKVGIFTYLCLAVVSFIFVLGSLSGH